MKVTERSNSAPDGGASRAAGLGAGRGAGQVAREQVAKEAAKFDALGSEWRAADGAFAPLHAMQKVRLDYVRAQALGALGLDPASAKPLSGLRLADLGAGGGLASEPMARLGAKVVGVDPSAEAVALCRERAEGFGLDIDYRRADAESFAEQATANGEAFDVVLALEVVEHAPDLDAFAAAAATLLRPGGVAVFTTLNRTAASYLGAIVAAERLLGWLARGTHDWANFPKPEELTAALSRAGLEPVDVMGFAYDPLSRRWRADPARTEINYAVTAIKPAS